MKTLQELYKILSGSGIPCAYQKFDERDAPDLPLMVYTTPYANNFSADGITYQIINHVQIDLYTKTKDLEAEGKVENALSSFFWNKEEEYLEDERCYRVMYELEV